MTTNTLLYCYRSRGKVFFSDASVNRSVHGDGVRLSRKGSDLPPVGLCLPLVLVFSGGYCSGMNSCSKLSAT